MEIISLTYPHELNKEDLPQTVAAIGFFDGIHKGHQKVINQALNIAKNGHKQSAVITFDPHPSVVLQGKMEDVQYLTPLDEKAALIEKIGIDRLYIIRFDRKLAQLSPEGFLAHFITGLNIDHLVAGYDFTFGFKGAGNMKNIHQMLQEPVEVSMIDKLNYKSEKISSTRIRNALLAGNITEAEELLGRSVQINGEVVHGDKRGRTIGYPTANLSLTKPHFLPKIGVYAVEVIIDGNTYYGMANLGYKPTFSDQRLDPKIEVHIFDFDENLYGREIQIIWKQFIREEVKFSGIDQLINQLKQDERNIRQYFS
ncbi:riboflavin kinase / FMN adenylyltransferase [Gracilibacillus ureilyticus]|uniref:Riboflavin biosynthesis protein n=1 Tax=Gracilibacillus ureilyticus TaxID=531814 RepID=A0A1H9L8R3_9BACI|nr:bifunctional riboflavin kinase/FAD synthetase [Gracilibacillus ureilyticus]SER07629.1 riboflavin kinase / FMN adenylyltransferase [Gracilibacillus ureilyticus]